MKIPSNLVAFLLQLFSLVFLSSSFFAQAPSLNDLKVLRNPVPSFYGKDMVVSKIVSDSLGNKYIAGNIVFTGANFDVKTGNDFHYGCGTVLPASGAYIAKYDSLNNLLWTKTFPGNYTQIVDNMVIDNAGNLILSFAINFWILTNPPFMDLNTDVNIDDFKYGSRFFAKYDSNGNYIFGNSLQTDDKYKITVDNNNNIFIYGSFSVTIDFDLSPATSALTPMSGRTNAFVVKYSPTGTLLNSGAISSNSTFDNIYLTGLIVTAQNDILVSGSVPSTNSDFDLTAGTSTATFNPGFFIAKYNSSFILQDLKSPNLAVPASTPAMGYAIVRHMIPADANSFYAMGEYMGLVDFNFGTGIDTLPRTSPTSTVTNYFVARYSHNLNLINVSHFGEILKNQPIICSDKKRKQFYVGHFLWSPAYPGSIDYDPTPATYTFVATANKAFVVARYDSTATFVTASITARSLTGSNFYSFDAVNYGKNRLIMAGIMQDSADFDPSAATTQQVNRQGGLYLSDHSASLTLIQANSNSNNYDPTTANTNYGHLEGIRIIKSGADFLVFGKYVGRVDYNPNPNITYTVPSYNYNNPNLSLMGAFFGKFDANMNPIWVKQLEGGTAEITKARVDATGNIIISGTTYQSGVDLDPSQSGINSVYGTAAGYVAKYSSTGIFTWSKILQNGYVYDFALDNQSNVVAVGAFTGPTSFNTSNVYSSGGWDAFVLKLSAAGTFSWVETSNCLGNDQFNRIEMTPNNDMWIAGGFGVYGFSFINSVASFSSSSATDAVIIKLSAARVPLFAQALNGGGTDFFTDIQLDAQRNIYLVGKAETNNIDFDFGTNTALLNIPAIPGTAAFIAKYDSVLNFKQLTKLDANFLGKLKIQPTDKTFYLYGENTGPGDFDPGNNTKMITGGAVLAKLDSSGNYLFAERLNKKNISIASSRINDLIIDNNNITLIGDFYSISSVAYQYCNFQFDTTQRSNIEMGILRDLFVASYCNTPNSPSLISGNTNLCSGSNATLTVGSPGIKWYSSPNANTPFKIAAIHVTSSLSVDTTFYIAESNSCGSSYRRPVTVKVFQNPQTAISGPTVVCLGQSITLQASGATSYTWSTGPTSPSISLAPAVTSIYTLSSNNPCGAYNKTITIQVTQPPTLTLTSNAYTICEGNSAVLNITGANTYSWSTNQTGGAITVSPNTNAAYSVTGTSSNGCQATASVNLTVLNFVPVSIGGPVLLCQNNTFSLIGYSAATYTWSTGSTNTTIVSTASLTGNVIYSVAATHTNGCTSTALKYITVYASPTLNLIAPSPSICLGATLTLTATGAYSYTWSPVPGYSSSLQVTPSSTQVYSVTGGVFTGCTETKTISITVNSLPLLTITSATNTICKGDSVNLIASGANSYLWSNGLANSTIVASPSLNTVYNLTGTDLNGCSATTSLQVFVNPPPVISFSPQNPTICIGASVTLSVTGANTYSWANGPVTNTYTVSPQATMNYSVLAIDNNSCKSYSNILVSVLPQPTIIVMATPSIICAGETATLSANGANTYSWTNNQSGSVTTVSPVNSTTYSVYGTGFNNCSVSANVNVTVNPLPIVSIVQSNSLICAGETVTLSGQGANTYSWSNGTINSSLILTATSNTLIFVTGFSSNNCAANATVMQSVFDCTGNTELNRATNLSVSPNPFNEKIIISGLLIGSEILVYNGLGQVILSNKIFETSLEINLSQVANGIYYCVIQNKNVIPQTFKLVKQQ